jgi:hypothetical protein
MAATSTDGAPAQSVLLDRQLNLLPCSVEPQESCRLCCLPAWAASHVAGHLLSPRKPGACRHWEERNRVSWSQQRLTELLGSGLPPAQLDETLGSAQITGLRSCTGEVCVVLQKAADFWYHLHAV